jgi:hypothetical protein
MVVLAPAPIGVPPTVTLPIIVPPSAETIDRYG